MERMEDREMRIVVTLNAPVQLVWQVWTDPNHIVNWWGPAGFTTTMLLMDFKEGGEWKLTLHGPDGTDYPNRSVYKDIVPSEKIVYEHFNPHFITTVLFTPKGEQTEMDWSLLFDDAAIRDIIVKVNKADEGLKQNIEKLGQYLAGLQQ